MIENLHQLWLYYIGRDALAFAVAHACLFIWSGIALFGFARWRPKGTPDVLWLELSSRAEYVRGVIGLFLIVGIAGTFFGLFGFAVDTLPPVQRASTRTAVVRPSPQPAQRATQKTPEEALRGAMAKAFPVGFAGLVLTLGFQLVADSVESSKRRRIQALAETASETSLVAGVRELQASVKQLSSMLAPLSSMSGVIAEGLQPVVRELGGALSASAEILRAQGDRLESGKDALVSASERLGATATDIARQMTSLTSLTGSVDAAVRDTTRLAAEAGGVLAAANAAMRTFATDCSTLLDEGGAAFRGVAADAAAIRESLEQVPTVVGTRLVASIETPIQQGIGKLESTLYTAVRGAFTPVQERMAEVVNTQNDMRQQVDNTLHYITANTDRLSELTERGVKTATAQLTSVVGDAEEDVRQAGQKVVGAARTTTESLSTLQTAVAGEVKRIDRLHVELHAAAGEVRSGATAVLKAAERVDQAATHVRGGGSTGLLSVLRKFWGG